MITTILLALLMMAGMFLMLWAAVGFIQDKRLFSSAPEQIRNAIQPKDERFRGQHALGWVLLAVSLVMLVGALLLGACDGARNGFGFWEFFARFAVMLLLLKAFDILFFDWFLLCRSQFYPHYFPEVAPYVGPQLFGFNKKSHAAQIALIIVASLAAAWVCAMIAGTL